MLLVFQPDRPSPPTHSMRQPPVAGTIHPWKPIIYAGRLPVMLMVLAVYSCSGAKAQKNETAGWIFLTHTQKVNERFDVLGDLQIRTADQVAYLNTLLLRTGINYKFKKIHSIAFGFAYKSDVDRSGGKAERTDERRIFEQYLYKPKVSRIEMQLRARLKQRWIKENETIFSQRLRGFVSAQIPLATDKTFSKGLYAGIQNEIFLNVTRYRLVNNSVFDQNRIFLSVGYRWSKAIDTEIGYMFWYQQEMNDSYRRHIIQLQVTTEI